MKLTTVAIPAIEMTRAEYRAYWENFTTVRTISVEGKRIKYWNQNDGHNEILMEGETTYRVVVITTLQ